VTKQGTPLIRDGRREWVEYDEFDFDDRDFGIIGASFAEKTGLVRSGKIANATAYLLPQREFVDYAVEWIEKNRQ
jgi:aminoglycoside 3-N-acetyltransferase